MAKKASKGMYASAQAASDEMSTPTYGGDAPDQEQIIKSANARSQTRHEVKGDQYADLHVLPTVDGPTLDKAGINDSGYLTKKNLKAGVNVFYNTLPPGMDIEDQELIDVRRMELKTITDLGYPGDGWT